MAGVNKVILLGNLGRDPEISYTPSGMAVCKISLATSRRNKDGQDVTAWHRCTAFGRTAEIISQYMAKGRQLYIEGELSYGQYEKDGVTHYTTDIIVNQFTFVGSGGGGGGGGRGGGYQQNGGFQGNQQGGYQNSGFQGQGPQGGQQNGGFQNQGYQGGQQNSGYDQGGGFNDQPDTSFPGGQPTPPDDDIPF